VGIDELSAFDQRIDIASDDPLPAFRAPFGVGNGLAFTTLGLASPANRLHGSVGPTYDKGPRFFGDLWFTVERDGVELPAQVEWTARPKGTAIVVTRADGDDYTLYTVDFAPRPTGVAGPDVPPAIGRIFLLEGEGDLALRLHSSTVLEDLDGHLIDDIRNADDTLNKAWPSCPGRATLPMMARGGC